MSKQLFYQFSGTDLPIELNGCADVAVYFPSLFQCWPYEMIRGGANNSHSILQVEKKSNEYVITSDLYNNIETLQNPLNAACSLIADLAWARLNKQPELLCFHGAAVEFNGQLVLFPNNYKAGKSTLTACLSALGKKVFTDDYLPLELDAKGGLFGLANGAAPRLRLPIPNEFSDDLKRYIKEHSGPQNKQYLYLKLKNGLLADHDERLPISNIILLDRQEDASPELRDAEPSEVLRRLIKQNFSRSMNPARILELLGILVANAKLKVLTYSNAEEASKLLDQAFAKDTAKINYEPVKLRSPDQLHASNDNVVHKPASFEMDKKFVQSKSVIELSYDGDSFVASSNGIRIHHLDRIAKAIWIMFEKPTTALDVIEIFKEAFPNETEETIQSDINKTVSNFMRCGLLASSES